MLNLVTRPIFPSMRKLSYTNGSFDRKLSGDRVLIRALALASDVTLRNEFVTGAKQSSTQATVEVDIVESLYRTLLDKVCNARCNEF